MSALISVTSVGEYVCCGDALAELDRLISEEEIEVRKVVHNGRLEGYFVRYDEVKEVLCSHSRSQRA